ncbi:MAG TPA: AI-2E family transporter [Patescibacteria group bacterium]
MPQKVEISYKTIVFFVLFLLGLYLLWLLKDVIVMLLISVILASAFHSPVDWLVKKKIPRPFSIIIVYLIFIVVVVLTLALIIPPLISQTTSFVNRFPSLLIQLQADDFFARLPIDQIASSMTNQLASYGSNFLKITLGFFNGVVGFFTLLVFTFYLLLDWRYLNRLARSFFSGKQEKKVDKLISEIEGTLGRWVRGQLALSLIVGVLVFAGLSILGVPYALPLALIAGILEIVPIIGPIIAAIPAVLVALVTSSPIIAGATAALYFVVQQLENHLIVPQVMARSVGLNPLLTILSLLIGGKLMGVLGALLAIPIVIIIKSVIRELLAPSSDNEPLA